MNRSYSRSSPLLLLWIPILFGVSDCAVSKVNINQQVVVPHGDDAEAVTYAQRGHVSTVNINQHGDDTEAVTYAQRGHVSIVNINQQMVVPHGDDAQAVTYYAQRGHVYSK